MARATAESSGPKTSEPFLTLSQSFHLGPLTIRYYGIIMAASILCGYLIAIARAKKYGLTTSFVDNFGFWLVIFGIIGARAYYVIFYPQFFQGNFTEVFKIWHGGQAIYGALIAGALVTWYFARKYKIGFFKLTDFLVFSLPLAQAIGRLGNFINYEAFGKPTNLPWKIYIPENFRPAGYQQYQYFHPTFAYEAIGNILLFATMLLIERGFEKRLSNPRVEKLNKSGFFTALYVLGYSLIRFVVEGLRLDSAYIFGLKVDQITAAFLIVVALGIIIYRYVSQTGYRPADRN